MVELTDHTARTEQVLKFALEIRELIVGRQGRMRIRSPFGRSGPLGRDPFRAEGRRSYSYFLTVFIASGVYQIGEV